MVTVFSVAAAPLRAAQGDMNTDVERPVAWRQGCRLEDTHHRVCAQCVRVCARQHVRFQELCVISMNSLITV